MGEQCGFTLFWTVAHESVPRIRGQIPPLNPVIIKGIRTLTWQFIITLYFYIFIQQTVNSTVCQVRLQQFIDSINEILAQCSMRKLYIGNPYECFLMMCILSEDPMGTFADVWEMAYDES